MDERADRWLGCALICPGDTARWTSKNASRSARSRAIGSFASARNDRLVVSPNAADDARERRGAASSDARTAATAVRGDYETTRLRRYTTTTRATPLDR